MEGIQIPKMWLREAAVPPTETSSQALKIMALRARLNVLQIALP